jgi:AcrR family transcriptional regulator
MAPGCSAREQIAHAADAVVAGLVQHIELYPVSLEVWAAAARNGTRERFAEAMRQIYREYRQQFADLIRAAQLGGGIKASADAEGLAAVLTGAVDGLMLQYWLDPSFDPRQMLRDFLSALFEGISCDE